MSANPFSSMFVFPSEYTAYGLPSKTNVPDIDNLVQLASTMIDSHCGRTDGNGSGSLVYSTYVQRIKSQSLGRNIYLLPHRPLAVVTQATIDTLSGYSASNNFGITGSYFYTGCTPNINALSSGSQSAIISASGRITYGRRGSSLSNPWDFAPVVTPIGALGLSSGPSQWFPLDMENLDYDVNTGEIWFADTASFVGVGYNEIVVTYNSGFDPTRLPANIKLACAAATKNLMAKGSGTTGMTSFSSSRSGVSGQFAPNIIDSNIANILASFVSIKT